MPKVIWALALILAVYGCGQDERPHSSAVSTATASPVAVGTAVPMVASDADPVRSSLPNSTLTVKTEEKSTQIPQSNPSAAKATQHQEAPALGDKSVANRIPRDVSAFDLFSNRWDRAAAYSHEGAASVEGVLSLGLHLVGASPVHVAFLGTAREGSVRCDWRGVARTLAHREIAIRFWLELDDDTPLPSATEVERRFLSEIDSIGPAYPETVKSNFLDMAQGGLSSDYLFMACYAEYAASEYLLGTGPSSVSVAYDRMGEARSYEL